MQTSQLDERVNSVSENRQLRRITRVRSEVFSHFQFAKFKKFIRKITRVIPNLATPEIFAGNLKFSVSKN